MLLGCLHAGCFIYLFFPFFFSVGYCRSLPLPCSSYRARQGGEKSDVIGDVPVPPLFPSFFIGSHASHPSVFLPPLFVSESPTFSSISSDNSFEPLDAFTWNAHQASLDRGNEPHARFFVDCLHGNPTSPRHIRVYHALVIIMKFRAIYFWDDGTDFNVELWAARSKFIEPSVLFHWNITPRKEYHDRDYVRSQQTRYRSRDLHNIRTSVGWI